MAEMTELTRVQKLLIEHRYTHILNEYERRTLTYAWLYNIMRIILVVGGVLVPALLSIQYMQTGAQQSQEIYNGSMTKFEFTVFWSTWTLSVLIGVCTSLVAAFKIDKRYYILHTTLEVMDSEIHQFLGLTGKYARIGRNKKPATHQAQVPYLFYSLEKLRLSQVQQEYVQFMEPAKNNSPGGQTKHIDETAMNAAISELGPPPASPPGSPAPTQVPVVVQPGLLNDLRRGRKRRTRSEGSIDHATRSSKDPPVIGMIVRDVTEQEPYPSVSLASESDESLTPHDGAGSVMSNQDVRFATTQ